MELKCRHLIHNEIEECGFTVKRQHDVLDCDLSPAKKKAKSDGSCVHSSNSTDLHHSDVGIGKITPSPSKKQSDLERNALEGSNDNECQKILGKGSFFSDTQQRGYGYSHQRCRRHLVHSPYEIDVGTKEKLQCLDCNMGMSPLPLQTLNHRRPSGLEMDTPHSSTKGQVQSISRDVHYSVINGDIQSHVGHCFNYVSRGMCELVNCGSRHCFPSYRKGDEFLSVLKGFCEMRNLNLAFKHVNDHIEGESHLVQAEAVLELLEACIAVKEESFVKCVMDFVKPEILSQSFCSKFILKCRKEPSVSFSAFLSMFSFCERGKIPLIKEANEALLEMFESHGNEWSRILSVMIYIRLTCQQTIPSVIFEKVLRIVNETRKPIFVEKMRLLMLILDETYLSRIDPTQVSEFSEQVTNKSCVNQPCGNDIKVQAVDQFMEISLTKLIGKCVALDSWSNVVQHFEDFIIQGRPGEIIEELQCAILSHGVYLGNKYDKFVREVAGGREISLSRKVLVGQLGVVLMLEAHKTQNMEAAFVILESMHSYGINYIELQQQEIPDVYHSECSLKVHITSSWVTLVAVDVCVGVREYKAAIQILKDTSWAIPSDSLDEDVRNRELCYRARVLMKLSVVLLKENIELGVKVMDVLLTSVAEDFKTEFCSSITTELDKLYTSYLITLLNERNADLCTILWKHYHQLQDFVEMIPNILRSLIMLFFPNDLAIAVNVFGQAMLKKVYTLPMPTQLDSVYTLKLPSYLSKSEFCLIINLYMDTVFKLIEERGTSNFEQNFPEFIFHLQNEKLKKEEPYICHVQELTSTVEKARKRVISAFQKMYKKFKFSRNYPSRTLHLTADEVSSMYAKWKEVHVIEPNGGTAASRDTGTDFEASTSFFIDVPSSNQVMSSERNLQKSSLFDIEKFPALPSVYPLNCFSLLLSSDKDMNRPSQCTDIQNSQLTHFLAL